MSDDRPRPGGLFAPDLGGGTPLPDLQRVRKPTIALDGGPAAERPPQPSSVPPPLPPPTVPVPLAPKVLSSTSAVQLRPSAVPPPLPERTVIVAPELEVSEASATPRTGQALGAAAWQGAGAEESELNDLTEEDLVGTVVASHRLGRRLGGGGFADVYLARHEFLQRSSAVKVLRRSLAASETTRRRFQREAEVLAALGHPNVVRLIDYGVLGNGRPFLVTELVEGETLRVRLDSGVPIPPQTALEWTKQLARGLAALHALGVVHRDLKPTNVMVSAVKNELKILDLGIARWLEPGDRTRLTEAGRLLGTPKYSAPEQLVDPASAGPPADLYALGSILYEMLAGRAPFWGGDRAEAIEVKRARPPQAPPGDTGMEAIAVALLEPDPEKRIGTAAELLARLDEIQLGVPTKMVPTPMPTQIIPSTASMPGSPVIVPSVSRVVAPRRAWVTAAVAATLAFVIGVGVTVLALRGPPADEGAPVAHEPTVDEPAGGAVGAVAAQGPAPVEAEDEPAAERGDDDEASRRSVRRAPRPAPRRATRETAAPASASSAPAPAPSAPVGADPTRAAGARSEVEAALAARGLTLLDLSKLVEGEAVGNWRAALSQDDARIDTATRVLVRAIQDAPITTAVIDAQIRRVLGAVARSSLPAPTVQKIEDRCFELRRDLASATASRRDEIAREVTVLERRLRSP